MPLILFMEMIMKNLFIRCSEEVYELAHALAKKESRSLNKQIIHMVQNEAESKGIQTKKEEPKHEFSYDANGSPLGEEAKTGLTGLLQTKKQESHS